MLPLPFVTVATLELELIHFRFAAFAYVPPLVLSLIVYVSPFPSVRLVGLILRLVGAGLTVTLQAADFPFAVLTVMFDVPAFLAVTLPLLSTEATVELLLDHLQD